MRRPAWLVLSNYTGHEGKQGRKIKILNREDIKTSGAQRPTGSDSTEYGGQVGETEGVDL